MPTLTVAERRFLDRERIGRLATADSNGVPHVVPVCFALADGVVYVVLDEKPKKVKSRSLKRVRNILENPAATMLADHYDDSDWSRLGWVMLRGRAEIIEGGPEHDVAIAALCERYSQYLEMNLDRAPVIALRIESTQSWGRLV